MKKLFIGFLLFSPSLVFAAVQINEIAWMGDKTSAYNEWMELYNDSDTEQNLSGWSIATNDEKFSIALSKTIQPKGYLLLEHIKTGGAPSTASDTLSYTGGYFSNDGGFMLFLENGDTVIQSIDANSKWPAGNTDKSKEETMQLNGTSWITAPATKKIKNATTDTSVIPVNTTTTTDTRTEPPIQTASLDTSAHTSPLSLSDFSQKQEVYISAGRNRIVSVGSPVIFESYSIDAKGTRIRDVSSVWSFGDGSLAGGVKVSHTYKYPGDYVVVLNVNAGGNEAVSRSEIRVFIPKIFLETEEDGAVSLMNQSDYEINLGGWRIEGERNSFVISPDTIIEPGKKIIFPKDVTGSSFFMFEHFKLTYPDGTIFSEFEKKLSTNVSVVVASTTPEQVPVLVSAEKNESSISLGSFQEKPKALPEVLSQPVKSVEPEKETAAASQTIILKKPDGFLSKIWNFFFK